MATHANPLWASHFADASRATIAPICENHPLARDTYRIRLECPDIAQRIRPGQFVMLRLPGREDPLLARPFALYDTVMGAAGEPVGLDVVYLVIGAMTGRLAESVAGQMVEVVGPLGNGFSTSKAPQLVMVAGGIGQTPFLALAKEQLGRQRYGQTSGIGGSIAGEGPQVGRLERGTPMEAGISKFKPKVTLCYGARSSEYLAGVDDFESVGVHVHVSTDDGSAGHHGFVTELLERVLAESRFSRPGTPSQQPTTQSEEFGSPVEEGRGAENGCQIVACGPEPMMEAVSQLAAEYCLPCAVSLETPMACGLGICFSCVARIRQSDGSSDYKRTCVDGPVFDAEKVVW